jgi:glycosyltransferase involved in cell wall biosynthesis
MFPVINSISGKNNINIKRINFGTDTTFFSPTNNPKVFNKFVKIISLRNLEKIYSVDTVIKAAKVLRDKFKIQFKIDIYGDGSQKEYLMQMINKLSLANYISLIGKYQYNELPNILNKYDLYISSSTSDAGLAASTSEAMSCGVIPVVSNNSENEFWMSNNSGFLYQTSSHEDLANKIIDLTNLDYDSKLIISQNARDKIIDYNSYENEMSKMLNIYRKFNESN